MQVARPHVVQSPDRTQTEQFGSENERVKCKKTKKSSRPTVLYG